MCPFIKYSFYFLSGFAGVIALAGFAAFETPLAGAWPACNICLPDVVLVDAGVLPLAVFEGTVEELAAASDLGVAIYLPVLTVDCDVVGLATTFAPVLIAGGTSAVWACDKMVKEKLTDSKRKILRRVEIFIRALFRVI